MKCALLLKGQMRGYKKCIPKMFDNFLNINDVDIFISTDKNDKVNSSLIKEEIIENYKNKVKKIQFSEEIDFNKYRTFLQDSMNLFYMGDKIVDLSNITSFEDFKKKYLFNTFQKDSYYLKKNNNDYKYSERELMIIVHFKNCIELLNEYVKETNQKYDYIFCYRPDLFIKYPLELSKIIINPQELIYRVDYMLLFNYNDLYLFDNILDDYFSYLSSTNKDKDDFYFLIERNFTNLLINNFKKVYYVLHFLVNSRCDDGNEIVICDKPFDFDDFYINLKKYNLLL